MPELTITNEQDLSSIAPKPQDAYADMSLAALTVYSLYWLHQWQLHRTIEAVSVLNWRLFPGKFAMVGFPDYPDAFRTNRSLLQGQPKYRNWLTGSATRGFDLNERGFELARQLVQQLGPPATTAGEGIVAKCPAAAPRIRADEKPRSVDPATYVNAARSSRLFEKWKEGILTDRDLIHVHSLLGVFDHTPVNVRNRRMRELERFARDIGDTEFLAFLGEVRRLFPSAFANRNT